MVRLEDRPPAPPRVPEPPLSPATREVLRRLGSGRGGLLVLCGEDPVARRELLHAAAQRAEEGQWEGVALRAHPLDAIAPYGALQPWFSRWIQHAPERQVVPPSGLDASFFTALAGFLPTLAAEPEPTASPSKPKGRSEETPEVPLATLGPEEVRTALLSLVEDRARRGPAILTLEDAQFLDPVSRDWLLALAKRLSALPVVLVMSLDPTAEGFDRWRKDLSQASTTWERWPPEDSARREEPPITSRLATLPGPAREALAAAVLAGPDATTSVLQATLGWEREKMQGALRTAAEAGWIEISQGRWSTLEPSLYPNLAGTLEGPAFQRLHRAIARALVAEEAHPRGARLFRLSEHWVEARDRAVALETLLAAGMEADRWGSPELAESRYRRALVLAQEDPSDAAREAEEKTYHLLARSRYRAGDSLRAAEAFQRALTLAQQRGERPAKWARYVAGLAGAQTRLGEDPEPLLKETLRKVAGTSPEQEAILWIGLAFYYRERGRTTLALQAGEKACEVAEQGRDPVVKVQAHSGVASAYFFGGQQKGLVLAREHLEKALRQAPALEGTIEASLVSNSLDTLSHIELTLGDPTAAGKRSEEAITAARRVGSRGDLLLILGNQAEVQLEIGNLARARELCQELRQRCQRFGVSDTDADVQQLLLVEGRVEAARGNLEPARRHFEHLVAVSARGATRYFLGQALACLVELEARRGNLEAARTYRVRLDQEGLMESLPELSKQHMAAAEAKLGIPGPERSS